MNIEAIISYLEAHPTIALILVVLIALVFGSLIKKLIKLALIAALVFMAALYFSHEEAVKDWRSQSDDLIKKAGGAAAKYGKEALKKGREAVEEELEKQTE